MRAEQKENSWLDPDVQNAYGTETARPINPSLKSFHQEVSEKSKRLLACGGQAFIETSLFHLSMSALPIIPKQNSLSVYSPANSKRELALDSLVVPLW